MKQEIRTELRRARRQLGAGELGERAERLARVLAEAVPVRSRVLGYLPMPGEPDVLEFLELHHARGGEVLVPVIAGGRRMDWVRWSPQTPTRRSLFAPVDEPEGERLPLRTVLEGGLASREVLEGGLAPRAGLDDNPVPLTVLVPALALDVAGNRLGQGGGYYDSMFGPQGAAPEADARFIGVVHSEELLSPGSFEVHPHDLRVPEVATEQGLRLL